jgi:hypothetical protein
MDELGYVQFLCHEGYNQINVLVPGFGHDAINYPSMQLSVKNNTESTIGVFGRTVTNGGPRSSMYNATIKSPKGVEITVKPTSLILSHTMQKNSFKVVVKDRRKLRWCLKFFF